MAKVMISIPDDLLGMLDAEVERRRTSRSALLQAAARHELGLAQRSREDLLADLDEFGRTWNGPVDVVALIRADRQRDDG
jgi:metal-responsive CopG/Arc/MetJ family transcriptional regulator